MTAAQLALAATLVVTGVAAAAGTVVARARTLAAVAGGVALITVTNGQLLTAGPTEHSLARAAAPLVVALAAVAVAGWRPATAWAAAGATLAGPVRQLLDDPFHDPSCRLHCDPNPLVLWPHVGLADLAHLAGATLLALSLVAAARHRDARSISVAAVALITVPLVATGATAGPLPAGLLAATVVLVDLARASTRSARVADAVTALVTATDAEAVLGEALGVARVTLGYPTADGVFVDADGLPLDPPALGGVGDAGHAVLDVVGPDGLIARLRGPLDSMAPSALGRALRGPARLALENNRLSAQAAVHARSLQASAQRLVLLADHQRRSFERDLHDGAQRHVLTLGLAVQATENLPELVRDRAGATVRTVLDQLREVAHGIRPPQLDTGGLAHAWADLADRSPVPVTTGEVPDDVDLASSTAAYRLLEDTLRTTTGAATATIRRAGAGWTATITTTAGGELAASTGDRLTAVGSSLTSTLTGRGWRHEAHLAPTLRE